METLPSLLVVLQVIMIVCLFVTSASHQKTLCRAVKCYSNCNQQLSLFWSEISSTMMAISSTLLDQSHYHPNGGARRHFVVVTNTSSSDLSTKSNTGTKPKMKKAARQFIPPKAAIFCRELLENTSNPEIAGIRCRM